VEERAVASIQKRMTKDGQVRWTMRVFVGREAATGRRKFIVKTFDRKKDAEEEARRLEHLKDQNNLARPSKRPLSEYLTHWLDDVKAGRVRARTLEDYRRLIRRYVQEPPESLRPTGLPLGDLRMDRLRPEHFQELYSLMWKELGLSPRSIRYLHTVLRQALEHAVATRALPRNPTDHVKPPSRPRHSDASGGGASPTSEKAIRAMSDKEVQRFLEAAREDRYFALWVVLLSGGLRPGEAFGLTWGDVDLESGRIHIRRALTRRAVPKVCACGHLRGEHSSKGAGPCEAKGCRSCIRYDGVKGWRLVEPKTDRARRTVLLPPVAVRALREWRSTTAAERLQLGAEYIANDFVFCNEFGRPLEASNLYERNFRRVMARAGLGGWEVRQGRTWIPVGDAPPVPEGEDDQRKRRFRPEYRVYDLRHTCATLLLKQGINPKVVSERLGHASITLTLDTYSHVLPDMQERAAEALEMALKH
jgi:integrase